jgi:hypothetical protein
MTPEEVALAFVEAINSTRAENLAGLMTRDHVFIDSDGTEVRGRERMRQGWAEYFAMVPDYRIEVAEKFARDDTVVLLGTATGTFHENGVLNPENRWAVPAAWRVVVDGDKVAVWQLYVNVEPMLEIMKRLGMV